MSGQFSVDTAAMGQAAASVEQAMGDISGYLKQLTGELDHMFAGWHGPGADAHQNAHDRFAADATQVTTALGRLHHALVRTHQVYSSQEAEQSADGQSMARQINQ